MNYVISEKLKFLIIIIYFIFAQLNFVNANHISKIFPLIPLILIIGLKNFPIKMFFFLGTVPLILFFSLLLEDVTNSDGLTFLSIHLGSAIFAYLVVNSEAIKKYLNFELFSRLIIYFGIFIVLTTFIEFIVGVAPGRIITGSQNLTSTTLTLIIPFALVYLKDYKLRLLYISLTIISVAILIKSRGLSLIILIVLLYYLKDYLKYLSRNKKIIIFLLFIFFFLILIYFSNERYKDLISGGWLHYRIYAWLRLIHSVVDLNPFFGNGPSNIIINFNQFQYIYPQIEIHSGLTTFANPHSDLIFMFASGGGILLVTYIFLHIFLIFKYLNKVKFIVENDYIKAAFIGYLVLIVSAQYDINNTTFATLLFFYVLQAFLFKNIVEDKNLYVNNQILQVPLIIALSLIIYFHKFSINIIQKYDYYAQNLVSSSSLVEWELGKYGSHFMVGDTLKAYNYLNTAGDKFKQNIFENLLLNSRKYNRYYEPSIHMSIQYFSFIQNKDKVLELYSDVLYKILIQEKIINISFEPENIKVHLGGELKYESSFNHHTLTITTDLLRELLLSSSTFGDYKFEINSKYNFNIIGDNSRMTISENVPLTLIEKILSYSKPLIIEKG
jgi:hypothetical protein